MRRLMLVGLVAVLMVWSVASAVVQAPPSTTEKICTVGPVGRDYSTITAAVNARVSETNPAYLCDRIIVGPHTYTDENVQIGARGKSLTIEPSREGGVRLLKGKTGTDGKPLGQAIFIIGAKHKVTIEGLSVTDGRTGILIQDSPNVTIRDVKVFGNTESGISAQRSDGTKLENIEAFGNKGDGIIIGQSQRVIISGTKVYGNTDRGIFVTVGSEAQIADTEIRGNKNGLVITRTLHHDRTITFGNPSTTELSKVVIKDNTEEGISVEDSAFHLNESHIFKNGGCGIKVEGRSSVSDHQGPSNWIVANAKGDVCGPDAEKIKSLIKKREILVPYHTASLPEAIKNAEPVRSTEDTIYNIVVEGGEYEVSDPLCIDRSVILQAKSQNLVTLKVRGQRPVVAIAVREAETQCLLHRNEGGTPKIIFQRAGTALTSGWRIRGGLTGMRVGSQHSEEYKGSLHLSVVLEDVILEEQEQYAIHVTAHGGADSKPHLIQFEMRGSTTLSDTDCALWPDRPRRLPEVASKISGVKPRQRAGSTAGIRLESFNGALVQASIINTEISNNQGDALVAIYRGLPPPNRTIPGHELNLTFLRISENTGRAVVIESQDKAKPAVFLSRIFLASNGGGGLDFQSGSDAPMVTRLENMQIIYNKGAGVRWAGQITATWEEPIIEVEKGGYKNSCEIMKNEGPGLRLENNASATLRNLRISYNGYSLADGKPVGNYTMSGIYAIGPASLELHGSIINDNAWNGIGLQSLLKATVQDNRVMNNEKWGIAQIIAGCVDGVTSTVLNREIKGSRNFIALNGGRLSTAEKRAAEQPDICPQYMIFLKEGTQQSR